MACCSLLFTFVFPWCCFVRFACFACLACLACLVCSACSARLACFSCCASRRLALLCFVFSCLPCLALPCLILFCLTCFVGFAFFACLMGLKSPQVAKNTTENSRSTGSENKYTKAPKSTPRTQKTFSLRFYSASVVEAARAARAAEHHFTWRELLIIMLVGFLCFASLGLFGLLGLPGLLGLLGLVSLLCVAWLCSAPFSCFALPWFALFCPACKDGLSVYGFPSCGHLYPIRAQMQRASRSFAKTGLCFGVFCVFFFSCFSAPFLLPLRPPLGALWGQDGPFRGPSWPPKGSRKGAF